jgi:ATP-dependent DNA helicase RecQ
LQSGLLELGNDGFAVIMLTKLGADALRSREPILVRQAVAPVLQHESEVEDQRPTPRKRSKSKGSVATESAECDQALFDALRVLRKQLADARGVPPYVVFGDVSLTAMARSFPRTKAEFLAIPGVGEKRYADFGAQFTEAIAQWVAHAQSTAFDASQ